MLFIFFFFNFIFATLVVLKDHVDLPHVHRKMSFSAVVFHLKYRRNQQDVYPQAAKHKLSQTHQCKFPFHHWN